MKKLRETLGRVVLGINYAAMLVCFVMVFVVAVDVILRKVSGNTISIKGSNEFSSYFLIVVCLLGIPALQVKDGHIWVNMLVDKLPSGLRSYYRGFVMLIETVIIGLFVYGSWMKMQSYLGMGRTDVLGMPKWPFALVCLIGFAEFFLLMVLDTLILFREGRQGGGAKAQSMWSDDQAKGI